MDLQDLILLRDYVQELNQLESIIEEYLSKIEMYRADEEVAEVPHSDILAIRVVFKYINSIIKTINIIKIQIDDKYHSTWYPNEQ